MGYWDNKPTWFTIDSVDELRQALQDPETWGEWATGKRGYKVYLYSNANDLRGTQLQKDAHAYPGGLIGSYEESDEYRALVKEIEDFLFGEHNQRVWRERHQVHHEKLGLPPLDVGEGGLHGTGKL